LDDAAGTLDLATGASVVSLELLWRLHLGLALDQPCPRCGDAEQAPAIGDEYTCEGGPMNGQTCIVGGVSPLFGGVSLDCPPAVAGDVSGPGVRLRIREMTTGTAVRQAILPCAAPLDAIHPDEGGAVCLNDLEATCSSNADCDPGIPCGIYCHCGFCDGDLDFPCFDDADCPSETTCQPGGQNSFGWLQAQAQPNACASLLCGAEQGSETCDSATSQVGACSLQPFRPCTTDEECSAVSAGTCLLSPRPCFEGTIARSGEASALRSICSEGVEDTTCETNADCSEGECTRACPRPRYAAVLCVPAPYSSAINAAVGLTGPATMSFRTRGPATTSTTLTDPACGRPVTRGTDPSASDCLLILQASVGSGTCQPECVCDVDASGAVVATDALICLKAAVGQPDVTLTCPC
jgi:hypothetical protein